MVDQLLSEVTIEQVVLLQRIQVNGDNVERLEEVFLLELTEQERLMGPISSLSTTMVTFSLSAPSTVTSSTCGWRWAVNLANHMPTR